MTNLEFQGLSSPGWLDAIGVGHGSSLSSRHRDSLRNWEHVLAPYRSQSFDLLQLGIGDGASLRTWREAFPEARLVGLDARRLVLDPPIADCILMHGGQTDLAVLKPLLRDYRFRLIIDDGSRHADDQVQTFLTLFPWLEPDSAYICAGLDEAWLPPTPQEGPAVKTPRTSEASMLPCGPEPERHTGPAWFAELGRRLTERDYRDGRTLDQAVREWTVQRASGVLLLRGSVVVTS